MVSDWGWVSQVESAGASELDRPENLEIGRKPYGR
jgi:hypothetical protein